ncbi:Sec1 family [Plasmodiophora brassicae]
MSWSHMAKHAAGEIKNVLKWAAPQGAAQTCVVLDPSLSSSVSRLVDMGTMKEHQIGTVCELGGVEPLETNCEHILYLVRPTEEMIGRLVFQVLRLPAIKADPEMSDSQVPVFVAFVPAATSVCARQLETLGLYGRLHVTSLPSLSVLCLDDDLASGENVGAFKRAVLDGDPFVVDSVVQSLVEIQNVYGRFSEITAKGRVSSSVGEALSRHLEANPNMGSIPTAGNLPEEQRISRVILLDRSLDMITPMLTQFTYEGVIDEVLGIESGFAAVQPHIVVSSKKKKGRDPASNPEGELASPLSVPPTSQGTVKCPLFSTDPLYEKIRDRSFPHVLESMPRFVADITRKLEEQKGLKNVKELKEFVKCLPGYLSEKDSISTHTNLLLHLGPMTTSAEFLSALRCEDTLFQRGDISTALDTIEYSIVQGRPWQRAVRLMCLWSQIEGGLKNDDYDLCCRWLIHGYGAALMLPLLSRMQRCGLLGRSGTLKPPLNWKALRADLQLIDPRANELRSDKVAHDIHFVHSYCGYAPLSVRLIEKRVADKSWSNVNAVLDNDEPSYINRVGKKGDSTLPGATLVYFVGGITRTEIAALRFLNAKSNRQSPYLICSTGIVNGSTLLKTLQMLPPA